MSVCVLLSGVVVFVVQVAPVVDIHDYWKIKYIYIYIESIHNGMTSFKLKE